MQSLRRDSRQHQHAPGISVAILLLSLLALPGCHSVSNPPPVLPPLTLSGNWQFSMAGPGDGSFLGGLQGGFLLQRLGSGQCCLLCLFTAWDAL